MVTKAIIQSVNKYSKQNLAQSKNAIHQYDVNPARSDVDHDVATYNLTIPIFDGIDRFTGSINDCNWTDVPAASLPHSEGTQYSPGDIVYVAIEDYDLNSVVILGMIPIASKNDSFYGAADTKTSIVFDKVADISFRPKGHMQLPVHTTMYDEYGVHNDYIKDSDFRNIAKSNDNFQSQIDKNRQSINSISYQLFNAQVSVYTNNSNVIINSNIWKSSSGCSTQGLYTFKCYKKTVVTEAGDSAEEKRWKCTLNEVSSFDDDNNPIVSETSIEVSTDITKDKLQQIYGISNIDTYTYGQSFQILVQLGPLPISRGGTGAGTVQGARQNLGVYQDKIVSSTQFDNIIQNNALTRNTIYYIYDN